MSSEVWAKSFGGTADDYGFGVTVDSSDAMLIVGQHAGAVGSMDFGGGPVPSYGSIDAFAAKLSSNGTHLWSRGLGGSSIDGSARSAVDGPDFVVFGYYTAQRTIEAEKARVNPVGRDAGQVAGGMGTVGWYAKAPRRPPPERTGGSYPTRQGQQRSGSAGLTLATRAMCRITCDSGDQKPCSLSARHNCNQATTLHQPGTISLIPCVSGTPFPLR